MLLQYSIGIQNVTVIGTSMGASTIWSYTELFGNHRLAKAVFVDQAPLQVKLVFLQCTRSVHCFALHNLFCSLIMIHFA